MELASDGELEHAEFVDDMMGKLYKKVPDLQPRKLDTGDQQSRKVVTDDPPAAYEPFGLQEMIATYHEKAAKFPKPVSTKADGGCVLHHV
jgi:hypothetical protein